MNKTIYLPSRTHYRPGEHWSSVLKDSDNDKDIMNCLTNELPLNREQLSLLTSAIKRMKSGPRKRRFLTHIPKTRKAA